MPEPTDHRRVDPAYLPNVKNRARRAADPRRAVAAAESLEGRTLLSAWYVSTAGTDANPGSLAQPFRTIQQAATLAQPGDTVFIRGGNYRETVTPAHSGTAAAHITYTAYNGENVVIDGADAVNGFVPYSGNIYRATQPWDLGEGRNQVFFNGLMLNEARFPNTAAGVVSHPSTYTISAATSTGPDTGMNTATISDYHLTAKSGFWVGSYIHIGNGQGWVNQTGLVTASGPGYLTFTYNRNSALEGTVKGNKYYLFGKLQALDSPGEWFHDASGNLYVYAPDGSNPNGKIEARHRQYAWNLSGLGYIDVFGVNAFSAAITSNTSTTHVRFISDNITYGSHFMVQDVGWDERPQDAAVYFAGDHNEIRGSTIAYCAGHAVFVDGYSDIVANNIIHDADYGGGNGAAVNMGGSAHIIYKNTIYNTGRNGIRMSHTTQSQVMFNLIHDAGLQTTDVGAIYAYGTDAMGTYVAYNDVWGVKTGGYGGVGLFLDNGCLHFILDHNLAYDCTSATKLNEPSNDNLLINNTLVGGISVASTAVRDMVGSVFQNNIFVGTAQTDSRGVHQQPGVVNEGVREPHARRIGQLHPEARGGRDRRGAQYAPYTNGFAGTAPDAGAFEYGVTPWVAGGIGAAPSAPPTPGN